MPMHINKEKEKEKKESRKDIMIVNRMDYLGVEKKNQRKQLYNLLRRWNYESHFSVSTLQPLYII